MVGLNGGMGMDDAGSGHHARLLQRLPFIMLNNKVPVVGDKDERGKGLSVNMERGAGIFLQNCHILLSIHEI